MGKVLVVEDAKDINLLISSMIEGEGYPVISAFTGSDAVHKVKNNIIDLIYLDLGLPDIDGIELIPQLKNISPDSDIVVITGMDDAQTAFQSSKLGVLEYILKPLDTVHFSRLLHKIMKSRLLMKNSMLACEEIDVESYSCESEKMKRLADKVKMAADVHVPVLIEGETGTGKDITARLIHRKSGRKSGIFVKVDCGTLSANLIESELFGHEKGAFTDAKNKKKGLVEMADGGTLFLDEIGNLPVELQPKLLRLVDEHTFRRVGGVDDINVDVRIIAATNSELGKEVDAGKFRSDLYYRLNVVLLKIPLLRERKEDILIMANYFIRKFNTEFKKQVRGISEKAEELILNYAWPGNVRELINCIERAVIFCRNSWITPAELYIGKSVPQGGVKFAELIPLKQIEKKYVEHVLESVNGNKTAAAKILGISRTTLREKL